MLCVYHTRRAEPDSVNPVLAGSFNALGNTIEDVCHHPVRAFFPLGGAAEMIQQLTLGGNESENHVRSAEIDTDCAYFFCHINL